MQRFENLRVRSEFVTFSEMSLDLCVISNKYIFNLLKIDKRNIFYTIFKLQHLFTVILIVVANFWKIQSFGPKWACPSIADIYINFIYIWGWFRVNWTNMIDIQDQLEFSKYFDTFRTLAQLKTQFFYFGQSLSEIRVGQLWLDLLDLVSLTANL